jgi:DNA-binding transcriptional LysR family regulator
VIDGKYSERSVSQPPLSKSIKNLEDQLGAQLLVRTRRRVELTPAGQGLLEQSEKIFQELENARIEVRRHSTGQKGLLRIGCEDGTSFSLLPPLLQKFQNQYPGAPCSVATQPMADLIVALRAGDLDAGILPLPLNDPGLELVKLGSCSMVAAMGPHLPLAQRTKLQLRDVTPDT